MQKLTEKQHAFVVEYANNGGNATKAAKMAGYSEKSAHEIARQLLELPHVQSGIHQKLMQQRFRSGATGLNAMVRIAEDDKAPAAARVSAARALMEHAGLLGSAKEVIEVREQAKQAQQVDYKEILAELAKIGREASCSMPH